MNIHPTWLSEPALQQFFAATRAIDGEARAVGGAVRDTLMGRPVGDVDIASTLPPHITMELAKKAGWKAIPTGIDHGTVTLVLPNRVIEVTTLRRDIETDGRHAIVAYTDNWQEDAARRDFTINALYMDAEGRLYDYFDGQKHLNAHAVCFIGDAAARIKEDGLRILRYFRFLATHGKPPIDPQAAAAITQQKAQLSELSGERIQQEMKKLLSAPHPTYALEQMAALGLAPFLTHGEWSLKHLAPLIAREQAHELSINPWLRLMALILPKDRMNSVEWVATRWKLSNADRKQLIYLAQGAKRLTAPLIKRALYDNIPREWLTMQLTLDQDDDADYRSLLSLAENWHPPAFPITAADLMAHGMQEGKALGDRLRALESKWIESDYRLGKEALLANTKS
jgi:tRNA nucleotidyltransferase/poly(A) polymerase